MSLHLKFNVVMLTTFVIGLALSAAFIDRLTEQAAQRNVRAQAEMMMGAANAVLHYTDEQVSPLLSRASRVQFLPQSVPFYTAQQVFNRLAVDFPEYSFRQPASNPTNPADKPASWESDIIEALIAQPEHTSLVTERTTEAGKILSYSQPVRVSDSGCLSCHSTPEAAPKTMLDVYGRENGFGWKPGSIVGAKIVSVPLRIVEQQARRDFWVVMTALLAIFAVMLLLLNILLHVFIVVPVRRISRLAEAVSLGNMDLPDFDNTSHDEIGALAQAFSRMRRSLVAAMGLLET
jgi:HAMP domain-containing protein